MWKVLNQEVDLWEPTSFQDHENLNCTKRQCQTSEDIVDNYRTMFESRISAGGTRAITIPFKIFVFLHGLMTWLVMQRNVWNDIVSWQTRRLNNSAKYLLHASMTTTSNKKWNLLENCHKFALKLFWNAKTWQDLDDLIFYGQRISLHDQSQNGPRLVANAWIDWFQIYIIHVKTNNIVMWVTLPNNADKDCFKILTSREILKIQNPLRGEHYAFLEVILLFQ